MKELNQKHTLNCRRADPPVRPVSSPPTAVQNKRNAAPRQKEHGGSAAPGRHHDVVGTCGETPLTWIYSQFTGYETASEPASRLQPLVIQDRA